jgi:hypothetical protein
MNAKEKAVQVLPLISGIQQHWIEVKTEIEKL